MNRSVSLLNFGIQGGLESNFVQAVNLILQEGHQGLDDNDKTAGQIESLADERNHLEAARLSAAGGEDNDGVLVFNSDDSCLKLAVVQVRDGKDLLGHAGALKRDWTLLHDERRRRDEEEKRRRQRARERKKFEKKNSDFSSFCPKRKWKQKGKKK